MGQGDVGTVQVRCNSGLSQVMAVGRRIKGKQVCYFGSKSQKAGQMLGCVYGMGRG